SLFFVGFEVLFIAVRNRLGRECLRLFFLQQLLGLGSKRLTVLRILALVDVETKAVRALAPVENVGLAGGIVPFDQRPAARRAKRQGLGGLLSHYFPVRRCKG